VNRKAQLWWFCTHQNSCQWSDSLLVCSPIGGVFLVRQAASLKSGFLQTSDGGGTE